LTFIVAKQIAENNGTFPTPTHHGAFQEFERPMKTKKRSYGYSVNYMTQYKEHGQGNRYRGKEPIPSPTSTPGEMSGHDVTNKCQLSMAKGDNAIMDSEKAGVVDFAARMVRSRNFATPSLNSSRHRRSRR
jgi:hypothetical protein